MLDSEEADSVVVQDDVGLAKRLCAEVGHEQLALLLDLFGLVLRRVGCHLVQLRPTVQQPAEYIRVYIMSVQLIKIQWILNPIVVLG